MECDFKVEPIGVKYMCDKCSDGEMIFTQNSIWNIIPPQYEHKCDSCGGVLMLEKKYPIIKYKRI